MIKPAFPIGYARRSLSRLCAAAGLLAAATIPVTLQAHDDDDLSIIPPGQSGVFPYTTNNPVIHGKIGPLIVMHAMSVHNSMVWKTNDDTPKVLMFQRHSGYRADEVANPDIINFLILNADPVTGKKAYSDSAPQFNASFRRSFDQLCYGGYQIIHDVSQSVPVRIRVDQTIETAQLWDTGHPDAYNYDHAVPKYDVALLNNHDAETNFAAWKNMGPSRGLYYDMYCPGFCTLEDGRAVFMGGHDMNSQNGNYRIQVFDPDKEAWLDRHMSCMRAQYGADPDDPYSEKFFQAQKDLGKAEKDIYFPSGNSTNNDCNPHALQQDAYSKNYPKIRLMGTNGTVTHPGRLPSDMRYARWYPGSCALPGNKAYMFGGWDRDESFPLNSISQVGAGTTALTNFFKSTNYNLPANWRLSGYLPSAGNVPGNKIVQIVPEVYDGTTDTTLALENARLYHSGWYPDSMVVQAGPGVNDWKVIVLDGDLFENLLPIGGEIANSSDRTFTKTWLVDVQGAMNDPDREKPQIRAGKWLKYIDASPTSHSPFSGGTSMMEIDTQGRVVFHRLFHFGGSDPVSGANVPWAEMIDLAPLSKVRLPGDAPIAGPKWVRLKSTLYQRALQNYVTPLPDGNMVILGGNGGTNGGIENWSLHLQMVYATNELSVLTNGLGMITKMDKCLVPRDEHGIIQLYPDATVFCGGQNRNGIVRSGDDAAPGGDSDLGVNCAQFYRPPYLFDANTNDAVRPVISAAPKRVDFGVDYNITVANSGDIGSVCMIRPGSMSHALCTDRRYIKLPFSQIGGNMLRVTAPVLRGTAIGGYWYLFVVNKQGVPSVAKIFVLGDEVEKRVARG